MIKQAMMICGWHRPHLSTFLSSGGAPPHCAGGLGPSRPNCVVHSSLGECDDVSKLILFRIGISGSTTAKTRPTCTGLSHGLLPRDCQGLGGDWSWVPKNEERSRR